MATFSETKYPCPCALSHVITDIARQRGWAPISEGYITNVPVLFHPNFHPTSELTERTARKLVSALRMTKALVSNEGTLRIECAEEYTIEDFLLSENKLKFFFQAPLTEDCQQGGRCGFILKTTPATTECPDSFDIRLCTDPGEYEGGYPNPPSDIHFHDNLVFASNMHFVVERTGCAKEDPSQCTSNCEWYCLPVSWFGKPECDLTAAGWKWGIHRFYLKSQEDQYRWNTDEESPYDSMSLVMGKRLRFSVFYHT